MSTGARLFPIQSERGAKPHPLRIPWHIAELAYSVYSGRYGRGQSLERLAERGGFGPGEMDMFLPDWRERCEHDRLTAHADAAVQKRDREWREAVEKYLGGKADWEQRRSFILASIFYTARTPTTPETSQ